MNRKQIEEALISLSKAIRKSDAETIALETQRLDLAIDGGEASKDPQLRHFLQRRSYEKALAHLQGERARSGA